MTKQTTLLEVSSNFSPLPATIDTNTRLENPTPDSHTLFNQAIEEGWNTEMDWLWLATKVKLDSQRHYCLWAALRINPESSLAKKGLWLLKNNPGHPLNF